MLERANLLGAIVAVALFALYIVMFILRLTGRVELGHWIASAQFLTAVPLIYLLVQAPRLERRGLYYVQIILMLLFLVVELFLDYILQVEFRQNIRAVIAYVVFFFAAAGGMLGIAAEAGRPWTIASIVLFLIMAVLAFVQRAVTGM